MSRPVQIILVFVAVLTAFIEIASRTPLLLLFDHAVEGQKGELDAKSLQAQAVAAQIAKTEAEAKAADTQARLNAMQQEKVAADTLVAKLQAKQVEADTRLKDSQTNKTDIETTKENLRVGVGLLALGALAYGGKKIYDAANGDSSQQTQTTSAQPLTQAGATGASQTSSEQNYAGGQLTTTCPAVMFLEGQQYRAPENQPFKVIRAAKSGTVLMFNVAYENTTAWIQENSCVHVTPARAAR